MRFSFKTAAMETTWPAMRDMWVAADDIDVYDAGWNFDHFYPLYTDPSGPCLEGWTTLAAFAQLTTRLRVGTMVNGNTYRHPAVLANMAATLDHISNGRFELGIGAGWAEHEHLAYGIDLPPLKKRFDMFDEACEVIHRLLTETETTFVGEHYRLTRAFCEPKPLQRPRPPIVIGGKGEKRTLRAVARWADQWNYPTYDLEDYARKIEVLTGHCAALGRDPAEIEFSVQVRHAGDAAATAAQAADVLEAGADHVVVYFPTPHDPAQLEAVAPELAALR